jgi:hypothetical protein
MLSSGSLNQATLSPLGAIHIVKRGRFEIGNLRYPQHGSGRIEHEGKAILTFIPETKFPFIKSPSPLEVHCGYKTDYRLITQHVPVVLPDSVSIWFAATRT